MAGAVSAGAYSAGAMSVLLEAIRLWESGNGAVKDLLPKHRIKIKGMTGASAGSIQAALSSLDLFSASYSQDLGLEAWTSVSFDKLLDNSDHDNKSLVKSILNTNALRKVTDDVVSRHRWGDEWPVFIDDEYELRLSITNLRGVPYNLEMPTGNETEFGMSRHSESLRYRFNTLDAEGVTNAEHFSIKVGDASKADLSDLTKGALASSAFPFAFEPVKIDRPTVGEVDIHDELKWLIPEAASGLDEEVRVTYKLDNISPSWKTAYGRKDTVFSVDGGVINNEPVLEAFKLLYGEENISAWGNLSEQISDETSDDFGRVIFIDPFPNSLDLKVDGDQLRVDMQAGLLQSAVVRNGRFSEPLIVSKALRNRIGLVYPSNPLRNPEGNSEWNPEDIIQPLKSGSMGGFAGFFKKQFLEHDYELGRLNMKRFLRYHFTVPVTHFLVKDDKNYIKKWAVENEEGNEVVPIIPILNNKQGSYSVFEAQGEGRIALYRKALSKYTDTFQLNDRKQLQSGFKKRFSLLGSKLIGNHKANAQPRYEKGIIAFSERWISRSRLVKWVSSKAVNVGWRLLGKGFLTNTVLETIENNLAKQGLLHYKIYDADGNRIGIDAKTNLEETQHS